jgi:CDP-glucose 4,6-dehydratase
VEEVVMGGSGILGAYRGLRVLVTGDTGFKGSWLCAWLLELGADVTGFALPAEAPSHFEAIALRERIRHVDGDLRDVGAVRRMMEDAVPEVVFHLGAQALVRDSYDEPVTTFATNVLGTVHVLDAIRAVPSVRAAVIVTSDKCYENLEWEWAYRENDRMGGHDPYSASKGAAELVVSSFRRSFFGVRRPTLGLASARAGNVIAGGDWALGRLIPDCARTLLKGGTLTLRNPRAVRPWQHVLDPLGGYLVLGGRLLASPSRFSDAYNFGPADRVSVDVETVARRFRDALGTGEIVVAPDADGRHEAGILRLACEKARVDLGWHPSLNTDEAIEWTVRWYRTFRDAPAAIQALTLRQLRDYAARFHVEEVGP